MLSLFNNTHIYFNIMSDAFDLLFVYNLSNTNQHACHYLSKFENRK